MTDLQRLHDKAAGLLVVRLGSNMDPPRRAEEDADGVRALLDRYPLGGVILFNGRWPETPATLADLQRRARQPLLVMTDMERGVGQQVEGATTFPHALAFGALGSRAAEEVEAFARASAREALACGIHVTFAPVADVNRNPQNPIISTRAFGSEPGRVAELAAAYVRGCRAEGLLSTAKHFPGHGNTSEDSHAVLPVVTDARAEIEAQDLPPFRACFAAGCELVMTAHVSYPALDPAGDPSTLSAPILQGLLRGDLGFEGVVISDSLHMSGIQEEDRTEADVVVEQLRDGVDLLLDPQDPEAIIQGVAAAVQRGELSEARLDEALARAQRLRNRLTDRFGADVFTDPAVAVPPEEVGSEAHRALASRIARAAVTASDDGGARLDTGAGLLAVLVQPHTSPLDPPEQPLGAALRAALPGVDYHQIGPETSEGELERLAAEAEAARRVLVALVVKPAPWRAFGLLPAQERFVERLARKTGTVVASLGSPRALEPYEGAVRVCTYSDAPVAQAALVDVLTARA